MNSIAKLLVCLVLLVSLFTASSAHAEAVTVFQAGSEGYNIYRIPAIVRAANGDLLAFCEAREAGDASEIDLVMKRSTDAGATWSSLQVVQGREQFRSAYPNRDITVGNPAPVVDLLDPQHTGRIWLPFTVENDRVFVTFSDDHGHSWSAPREITKSVKLETWGWYATGPVHSIQLQHGEHRGRLLVPCDHRLGDDGADRGPNGIQVVYSDDHGSTWQLGAIDDTYQDGLNSNETTAVELNDGRVYFNTRDQNGQAPGTRGAGWSRDGGITFEPSGNDRYKWILPITDVLDPPVVQCSLLRAASVTTGDDQNVILFSGPDESGPTGPGRSDLRIRFSLDEAQSWHDGPLIHTGPAAYSDLVELAENSKRFGVLYEAGEPPGKSAYQRIVFSTFTLADALKSD